MYYTHTRTVQLTELALAHAQITQVTALYTTAYYTNTRLGPQKPKSQH
jgi:hypothetical protein